MEAKDVLLGSSLPELSAVSLVTAELSSVAFFHPPSSIVGANLRTVGGAFCRNKTSPSLSVPVSRLVFDSVKLANEVEALAKFIFAI